MVFSELMVGNIVIKEPTNLTKTLEITETVCYNQTVRIQTRSESRKTCSHIYLPRNIKNVKRGVLYGKKHSFTCLGFS